MVASERFGPVSPWLLACFAACVVVGALAGVNPEYGVLAALGLIFAVVAIMDVTLGFVLFTIASFLDVISGNGSFSGTKVIGLVLFVSWLARIGTRRGTDLGAFVSENPVLTVSLLALVGWAALSFAWAFSPSTALGGAGRYGLDLILVPIAFSAIRTRQHAVWVVAAFVGAAVLSGAYGLVTASATTGMDAGRLTGTIGEANAEATVLAAAIPMAFGLVGVIRKSARLKLVALCGVVVLFASLVDTLSREGLVALGAVLVGGVIFGGRWRRQAAAILVIGVTATVGYYFVLAPATSRQRVTMTDTSGRSSLWTVAWRVVKDHPILGVGNDNFILVENQYINQAGAIQALYIVNTPKLTHNTLLESLADLGIPGLLTLVAVLGVSISAAVRAAWIFQRLGDTQMEAMARGLVLGLIAIVTSDMFVAAAYAKYLWIPLAICPVLLRLARRAEAEQTSAELAGNAGSWSGAAEPRARRTAGRV
jgi:putative inorganic carbon (HCO3(-)) transporter